MTDPSGSPERLYYVTAMLYADEDHIARLRRAVYQLLEAHNKKYLFKGLRFCLTVLCDNAERANAAKLFQQIKSERTHPLHEQTRAGFEAFYGTNRAEVRKLLRKHLSCIGVMIRLSETEITVRATNNAPLSDGDRRNTEHALKKLYDEDSIREALKKLPSNATLFTTGLVYSQFILKTAGCGPESIGIDTSEEGHTTVQLKLSIAEMTDQVIRRLYGGLIGELEAIPPLPENIQALRNELRQEDWDINRVAGLIERDPALVASILKIVNSGLYMLPARVANLKQAVALLGAEGVRAMALAFGSQTVLNKKYGVMEGLWDHSYLCGYYAQILGEKAGTPELLDELFLIGVLHDIGKIMLFSADSKTQSRFYEYCREQGHDPLELEMLTMGSGHALLGSLIAQKWRFPQPVISGISYHHDPLKSHDAFFKYVFPVYLANLMLDIEDGEVDASAFAAVPEQVRDYFKCRSTEDLADLHARVKARAKKRSGS